jgi:hypothetical protein
VMFGCYCTSSMLMNRYVIVVISDVWMYRYVVVVFSDYTSSCICMLLYGVVNSDVWMLLYQ